MGDVISNSGPGTNLPKPVTQQGSDVNANQAAMPSMSGRPTAGLPISPLTNSSTQPTTTGLPNTPPPLLNGQASTGVQHSPISPPAADDADLIEKEWVERAKAIVEKTRDDPHEQKREMSKYKADYVKKRYNKDLKVAED